MSTHDDDRGGLQQPGRSGQPQQPGEPGRPQQYGPPPHYGQPGQQYGQPGQPYAGAQPPYDGQQYQPSPYGQGQPYGQPTGYAQPYGGQPPYGQYGQYGFAATPAKPAPVVVAAVLGLVFSAIGTLVTIGLVAGGALLGALVDDLAAADPTVGELDSGAVTGVLVVLAVLALVWTVLMIWGSVWALTGRTRVLLLVGGAITVAVTGFFVVAGFAGASTGDVGGGGVVFFLLFFLAALAIVVLLALRPAAQYFAAHRVRRGR